mmetsp:Transcript_123334/g.349446  ORF Transcript_123334/g.349446 Transcript_123334/m.349446 type:complete len:213 (-) Transcript_123334:587-1225(-)
MPLPPLPSFSFPKRPTAKTPQRPQTPCTGKASTTSSILAIRRSMDAPWYRRPPTKPMMTDSQGLTKAHPAVMETRPASTPLPKPPTSSFLGSNANLRRAKTTSPATHGEIVVFTATSPAWCAEDAVCMARVLPGLKPYHPNQRMKVPRTQNGMWCASNFPSSASSKRPARGPTMNAPQSAPNPPTMWTMPLPAKSWSAGPPSTATDSPSPSV